MDSDNSGSDSLPTAVIAITIAVTVIVTLTVTAVVTFVMTCVCAKRIYESTNNVYNSNDMSPQEEKMLYAQVDPPCNPISKNDLELQPNPAYGTSNKVTMDTNPTYETCK